MINLLKVGFGFALFSFLSLGLLASELKVTELSGSYQNGQGNALAKLWSLPGEAPLINAEFSLYKEETALRLISPQGDYLLEDLPHSLLKLNDLSVQSLSILLNNSESNLNIVSINGDDSSSQVSLINGSARCSGIKTSQGYEGFIEQCLNSANVDIDRVKLRKLGRGLNFWQRLLLGLFKKENSTLGGSETLLDNIDIEVKKGVFEAKLKADVDIRVNLKANGKISREGESLKIHLKKVKASFLTITDKVFDELEKLNDPTISVQRPYIFIEQVFSK